MNATPQVLDSFKTGQFLGDQYLEYP